MDNGVDKAGAEPAVKYVSSALFVHIRETEPLARPMLENSQGAVVRPVTIEELLENPRQRLAGMTHVVVAGGVDVIKEVLHLAMRYDFSVGIIPSENQRDLVRSFDLAENLEAAVAQALRADAQAVDLIMCNEKILLFRAVIGRVPLMDESSSISRMILLVSAVKKFLGLKLLGFDFTTEGGRKIKTAACGCMVLQPHVGTLASRLMARNSSFTDGMVSLLITAPLSVVGYLRFLGRVIFPLSGGGRRLPDTVGYIRSPRIEIKTERGLDVTIDGEQVTRTPLICQALPAAVRINLGPASREENKKDQSAAEKIDVANLPRGRELDRARKKSAVPFFSYASEERFRDLFIALREDARVDQTYLVLMLLSTLLATVGLYLNSAPVIIGAMLLAPLMAPILSLAMGLLRSDLDLTKNSVIKIIAGVMIALGAAASVALLFPYRSITPEMQARLNPTLLDLAVAICAGIAGAYTKSFKEILQSLAGVAIAVALVPPLAVAGIGIGQWDFAFFSQSFLLFCTNLVGIILAAALTFRMLGYSAAVRGKLGIGVVAVFMVLISIPLYLSFQRIAEKRAIEGSWQQERFLVNGKYLIIQKVRLSHHGDKDVLVLDILARDMLTRADLTKLKQKIQNNFTRKMVIRAKITYIP